MQTPDSDSTIKTSGRAKVYLIFGRLKLVRAPEVWGEKIEPAVRRAMAKHPNVHGDKIVPYAVEENIWQGIEDLFMASPATRNIVNSGAAKVIGAIYDVGTGKVDWLPESKTYDILKKVESNPKRAMNAMASGGP